MKKIRSLNRERGFQPAQVLAISFVVAILVGTLVLLFPFSTKSDHISFIDALFTSTSAVCVTGLIVQDTPTYFSPVGQVVILILFQLGGLGVMTFSTLFLLAAGRKISITDTIVVQENFHYAVQKDFRSLIKNIFLFTFIIEFAGVLSFFFHWHKDYSVSKILYYSLFHSVSAFCNAGFSLFSDSFVSFRKDTWTNITVILLIIMGGLGFLVLQEGKDILSALLKRKRVQITLHTKIVLSVTIIVIVFSFLLLFLVETDHSMKNFAPMEKILSSLFQTVTSRTAGFNTMDLSSLSAASAYLLIFLMFIGASPGSTGGGVKTSTMGVIFAFLKSKITARDTVNIFDRTLPPPLVTRAFTVISLSLSVIFISSFILLIREPWATMQEVLFEVFSAFSTVGLSLGITPRLSGLGKILIILTMYIGRIGPLTMLYAVSRRRALGKFKYVEESLMIG
jgi:trk system potassium uptake protein TrkH